MKVEFDNATIKVWFSSISTSRNINNIESIENDGNLATEQKREINT